MRKHLLKLALIVAVVGWIFFSLSTKYRASATSVTGIYQNGNRFSDTEYATITILQNDFDRPIAAVIHHVSLPTADGNRESNADRRRKSSVKWQSHYPPDPSNSGVWINGKKQPLGGNLLVVCESDTQAARLIHLEKESHAAFINDARAGGDPVEFVKKWITDRSSS